MIVAAASIAVAVVLLDLTAVAVLLPTIRLDLGSSSSGAGWVLAAYLVAFAGLLPLLARVAGGGRERGRAFAAGGLTLMAVGAVLSATAGSTADLVLGRTLAGIGAAAIVGSLAAAATRAGRTALVLPALALALGPFVGGVFAEQNWWHVYFWAGLPLAAVAGLPALIAARPEASPPRDLLGALGLAAGLTAITIALIQAESWDWWWPILLLLAGLALARPTMPGPPAATAAVAGACLAALVFLMPEYFELVRRLSGLRSGTLVLALTVPAVTAWTVCRAVRLPLTLPGLAGAAAGLAALATLDTQTSYALQVVALGLIGAGLGAVAGAQREPAAPGELLAWASAGATLGLATTLEAFQEAQSDQRSGGASFEHALSRGVGWAAVVLLVWLALLGALLWRSRPASSAARPAGASSQPPHHPA